MTNQRSPAWLDQIERFGVKSLVKLVLAVFALLFVVILVSFLPGTDRLSDTLPIPFTAAVSAVGTLAILTLLYKIATEANTLVHQLETGSPAFRDCMATVVYWGVILLAIAVAYFGFNAAGGDVFERAGFAVFYPLFFVLMAMIPLVLVLVEVGVFVQARRQRALASRVADRDVRTDEELVYRILEENDGLIYQADFSEVTSWSRSKVSRVLSDMEAEGLLSRYRLGREKIVCLPGHEPDLLSSDDRDSTGPG